MEKSNSRLKILEKIKEYERLGRFNDDIEEDPESKELLPNKVDYLCKKLSSKIATYFANLVGQNFYEKMIKQKQLIINEINGIENFTSVKQGAIITCNHFNVTDNYAVWRAIRPHVRKKDRLYKVIKEGNYTNSPPPFGFIMRHCNTLPLSRNTETMKKFMTAMKTLLARGEKILVYPEQAMWWNYKKPRPLKPGAFTFAVANNAPVIPVFITMTDSDVLDADGFPVQKFNINFLPAIYPKPELSRKENIEYMKNENYSAWVKTYEDFYKIPLSYETEN